MSGIGSGNELAPLAGQSDTKTGASAYTWWDVLVAGMFTAVPAAMWVVALGYNAEARRIPLLIATPLTLLAAVEFGSRVRSVLRHRRARSASPSDDEDADADRRGAAASPGPTYLQPLLFLVGFVLLFLVFGQLLGTAIFAFAFLWRLRELRLVGAALFAGILTCVLWATAHLLQVEVYDGMLHGLIF